MIDQKVERWNTGSHVLGVVLGIFLTAFLIGKSISLHNTNRTISFLIYGICFILMFLSSSIYHGMRHIDRRRLMRAFDHSSIFIFIAGSYTPPLTLLLDGIFRLICLVVVWGICAGGILLKVFTYGKYNQYKTLSTVIYLIMGWLAIFIIRPIYEKTGFSLFLYILIGGLFYTIGTWFYKSDRFRYHHVIWHFFVLAGAISHCIGYLLYL